MRHMTTNHTPCFDLSTHECVTHDFVHVFFMSCWWQTHRGRAGYIQILFKSAKSSKCVSAVSDWTQYLIRSLEIAMNDEINGNFRILKMEALYHIRPYFVGIFPLHRHDIGLIHGRYSQFRLMKWPLADRLVPVLNVPKHGSSFTIQGDNTSPAMQWLPSGKLT